jgi:hypothetical protein
LSRSDSVCAFNDAVILGGNVPLDIVAKAVDEYVRRVRK